jgi:hypothetical protein
MNNFNSMNKQPSFTKCVLQSFLLAGLGLGAVTKARATGNFNSLFLLEDTQFAAIAAPEFWFEFEMKDLAKQFGVKEKHLSTIDEPAEELDPDAKPVPPARPKVTLDTEEGKLYEAGAAAYHGGDSAAAAKAWQDLLALPEAKRQARSVWAEYMLGRLAIKDNKPNDAPVHFQAARKLAAAGYQDEQALAAASYGWEAFVYKESDPSKAIGLYLRQLATGDKHAIISIRQTMPGEAPSDDPNAPAEADHSAWMKYVQDPLMRQVITRWHLAYGFDANNRYAADYPREGESEVAKWLKLMEKTKPAVEEADRLAWLAYREAAYDQAQRWLQLAPKETALVAWLKAKFALRAGDTAAAEQAMAKVTELTTERSGLELSSDGYVPLPHTAALADQGAVLLSKDKFPEALTSFMQSGHWMDAAYVAERVLTLKELQDYVEAKFPKAPAKQMVQLNYETLNKVIKVSVPPAAAEPTGAENFTDSGAFSRLEHAVSRQEKSFDSPEIQADAALRLRWLLARRMVREDQEAASKPYFPAAVQPVLEIYLAAIGKAGNAKAPAAERARAWWEAAWIARHAGLELFATEAGPDNAWQDGSFELAALHQVRRTGQAPDLGDSEDTGNDVTKPAKKLMKVKFSVVPSAEEKKRLAKNVLSYEYRHHYRWVAASLAKKSAALLPAGSEEKADVLNTAGSWMFVRDQKREEEFFFAIKETCGKTAIGQKVLAKKHTFALTGPWSGTVEVDEQ